MRYFPRGGKYNTYCYNDGLFYEEDPMMKRNCIDDGGHDCIVNPKFRGGGVC